MSLLNRTDQEAKAVAFVSRMDARITRSVNVPGILEKVTVLALLPSVCEAIGSYVLATFAP